jgi:WD40 repeat protein
MQCTSWRGYWAGLRGGVERFWEDYHGDLLLQGLDEELPASQGGIDRRGFEWFYWKRNISAGHITLKGHADAVNSVSFSSDGSRLASASGDGTVKVWDAGSGCEIDTFKAQNGSLWSMAPQTRNPSSKRLSNCLHDMTSVRRLSK